MLIQNTPHAEVRRQCLLDPETTLEEVIRKAELYTRTSNTDQLLISGINSQSGAINKMSSEYQKSTHPQKKASVESSDNKRWKICHVKRNRNSCP